MQRIASTSCLEVIDVEQLPTHGGLREWLAHRGAAEPTAAVMSVLKSEQDAGLESLKAYEDFQLRAEAAKFGLMEYLLKASQMVSCRVGCCCQG